MRSSTGKAVLAIFAALALSGCISAERRINANQAELYAEAIVETERVGFPLKQAYTNSH
jgi:hypothetical protein